MTHTSCKIGNISHIISAMSLSKSPWCVGFLFLPYMYIVDGLTTEEICSLFSNALHKSEVRAQQFSGWSWKSNFSNLAFTRVHLTQKCKEIVLEMIRDPCTFHLHLRSFPGKRDSQHKLVCVAAPPYVCNRYTYPTT